MGIFFRTSIASLMVAIAFIGVGIATMRDPTKISGCGLFTLAVTLMSGAILGVIVRRGPSQIAYAGFALFGWIYLALAFGPWLNGNNVPPPPLLSSVLIDVLETHLDNPPSRYVIEPYTDRQTGHSLCALVFAVFGSFIGGILGKSRQGHSDIPK